MLNEMDGFTREGGVMVIAATNNYKALDEALVRPEGLTKIHRSNRIIKPELNW